MRDKYIEEMVGIYYLWPEGDPVSDIATSVTHSDIACDVDTKSAKALVDDRYKLVDALTYAINRHGDDAHSVFEEIRKKFYQNPELLEVE